MSSDPGSVEFDKNLDINIDYDFHSNTDINFNKDVSINIQLDSFVHLEGNFAQITFDAEAVGVNGYVQADLIVLTIEDQLAMVSGTITSATG